MSSARFARLVQDAYLNNDLLAARQAYDEYQVGHCLNPRLQLIYDSHTQQSRYISVGCGRCYHCMESKINEWVTRMYAHAEDFKHVYFITLTYRSIVNPDLPVNKLLLSKLSQAVWNRDNFNSTKHYSYNPCVLCKKHYQDFLKRLRRNTGYTDISFCLSGEYGTKFGRPHFHIVLFSNNVITRSDVIRAWSVALWLSDDGSWSYKTNQKHNGSAHYVQIGRVDFNDLVSNGTFNTTAKIRVDGSYMNAANCFSYVCKYVVKRDTPNLKRVNFAYKNLFKKEQYVNIGLNPVAWTHVKEYLNLKGITYSFDTIHNLKRLKYEKTIFKPSQSIYEHGLCRKRKRCENSFTYYEELLPQAYLDFRNLFSPFCEFSRGCPIGSLYAHRNIQEFAQGVFTKPLLQDKGFVVPSYFRDKASKYLYGFREVRKTISGKSLALGGLVDLFRCLTESPENLLSPYDHSHYCAYCPSSLKTLPQSYKEFMNSYTGEHYVFSNDTAVSYKFDRHSRKYIKTNSVPLSDFIRSWCISLELEFSRNKVLTSRSKDNLRLTERGFLLLTDMGDDPSLLRSRFKEKSDRERKERSLLYNQIHNSLE